MPPRRRIAPSSGSPSPVQSDSESITLPTPPNRFNASTRVPSTAPTSIKNGSGSGKPSEEEPEEELVISDSEDQREEEPKQQKRPSLGSRAGYVLLFTPTTRW